jgi:plastocyanin
MPAIHATLLTALLMHLPAMAGTITGTVHAQGKPGTEAARDGGGKYDSHQFKFVERVNYDEMRDFVVYIDGPVGPKSGAPLKPAEVETKRISQKGAVFEPHVLPIMVGTIVDWPNNDDILHNVFSFSEAKPFDLDLYKAPVVKHVTFDKPGRVDVFCSIHTRMSCVVLVLENPYFAKTNARGLYTITNVPPGTYTLKAWHERLPPQSRQATVPETGELKEDFTLGIVNLPKP